MAEAYPLHWPPGWPRSAPIGRMGEGRFSVTPDQALRSLHNELTKLRAAHIVISSWCKLSSRGLPYAEDLNARMRDPGVAVYFQLKARPMVMAQDLFDRPYANARSLALAVAALRSLERHGGGHMMQRSFEGFAQLPPPTGWGAEIMRPWREVLNVGGYIDTLPKEAARAVVEDAYKRLARDAHPDKGGAADTMAELNVAVDRAREELAAL
jgi:hypothetical protein